MKFRDVEFTEDGYKIVGHNRFIDFILNLYAKRIARKVRKIQGLPKNVPVKVEKQIIYNVKVGGDQ